MPKQPIPDPVDLAFARGILTFLTAWSGPGVLYVLLNVAYNIYDGFPAIDLYVEYPDFIFESWLSSTPFALAYTLLIDRYVSTRQSFIAFFLKAMGVMLAVVFFRAMLMPIVNGWYSMIFERVALIPLPAGLALAAVVSYALRRKEG